VILLSIGRDHVANLDKTLGDLLLDQFMKVPRLVTFPRFLCRSGGGIICSFSAFRLGLATL
jgi:hypothetical protein